jgi:hypothetical protein
MGSGAGAFARSGDDEAMVPVTLIAALAENGVIGRDNGLPWRLKSDMVHFRTVTFPHRHHGQAGGDGAQNLSVDRQAASWPHHHRG